MKRKAFTLVELLVVISIIALLVSILLPSLSKARDSAKAVICKSNLRQWGLAFSMYEDDNDQRLPAPYLDSAVDPDYVEGYGAWYHYNTIGQYIPNSTSEYIAGQGKIFRGDIITCPAHLKGGGNQKRASYSFNYWIRDKATFNTAFGPQTNDRIVVLKKDRKLTKRLVLVDGSRLRPTWAGSSTGGLEEWDVHHFVGDLVDINYGRHQKNKRYNGPVTKWNNVWDASRPEEEFSGKANVLFADWHVGDTLYYGDNNVDGEEDNKDNLEVDVDNK